MKSKKRTFLEEWIADKETDMSPYYFSKSAFLDIYKNKCKTQNKKEADSCAKAVSETECLASREMVCAWSATENQCLPLSQDDDRVRLCAMFRETPLSLTKQEVLSLKRFYETEAVREGLHGFYRDASALKKKMCLESNAYFKIAVVLQGNEQTLVSFLKKDSSFMKAVHKLRLELDSSYVVQDHLKTIEAAFYIYEVGLRYFRIGSDSPRFPPTFVSDVELALTEVFHLTQTDFQIQKEKGTKSIPLFSFLGKCTVWLLGVSLKVSYVLWKVFDFLVSNWHHIMVAVTIVVAVGYMLVVFVIPWLITGFGGAALPAYILPFCNQTMLLKLFHLLKAFICWWRPYFKELHVHGKIGILIGEFLADLSHAEWNVLQSLRLTKDIIVALFYNVVLDMILGDRCDLTIALAGNQLLQLGVEYYQCVKSLQLWTATFLTQREILCLLFACFWDSQWDILMLYDWGVFVVNGLTYVVPFQSIGANVFAFGQYIYLYIRDKVLFAAVLRYTWSQNAMLYDADTSMQTVMSIMRFFFFEEFTQSLYGFIPQFYGTIEFSDRAFDVHQAESRFLCEKAIRTLFEKAKPNATLSSFVDELKNYAGGNEEQQLAFLKDNAYFDELIATKEFDYLSKNKLLIDSPFTTDSFGCGILFSDDLVAKLVEQEINESSVSQSVSQFIRSGSKDRWIRIRKIQDDLGVQLCGVLHLSCSSTTPTSNQFVISIKEKIHFDREWNRLFRPESIAQGLFAWAPIVNGVLKGYDQNRSRRQKTQRRQSPHKGKSAHKGKGQSAQKIKDKSTQKIKDKSAQKIKGQSAQKIKGIQSQKTRSVAKTKS